MAEIKVCIFDLDGVLVDTAKYHYLAWKRLANELGFDFTKRDNERLKGVSRMRSLEILLELGKKKYILAFDRDVTVRKQSEKLQKLAAEQWENTFNAIKDMIVIVDKDRRMVQANQTVRDTFPDLTLHGRCYEVFHGVTEMPEPCASCDVFETGLPSNSEYYDTRLNKWFSLTVYP